MKLPLGFICLLFITSCCFGQIVPGVGAKLNYTQVMFEHPQVKGADSYLVEVALDENGASFEHPVAKHEGPSTAVMISGLEFGKKYVWRYTGLYQTKKLGWKGPYKFETLSDEHVDKNLNQVRILQNDSDASAGGLITLDVSQVIVDRQGNHVWFLPVDSVTDIGKATMNLPQEMVNDLRVTSAGTITLINGERPQERNLAGRILWQAAPKSAFGTDSVPPYDYHHCLRRLANGDYMVLDRENVYESADVAKKWGIGSSGGANRVIMVDEVIREIDSKGKLVWKWSSENYFNTQELKSLIQSKPDRGVLMTVPGGHLNAFDVDENNGFIYAGFRNVSRVIKIDKKTGQVVCAWGNQVNYNSMPNGNDFFLKQHEATLLRDGQLAVFNNGQLAEPGDTTKQVSSIVVFTQPHDSVPSQLSWKFDCDFDSIKKISVRGGSVDELKNGNLLVCMGSINRVFEVTRSKRIVWSSVVETRGSVFGPWASMLLFKAHYASSLYPCYFTVQTSADTVSKKSSSFQLIVFNDGSESDSYLVRVSSPSGFYDNRRKTEVLPAGKSVAISIAPSRAPLSNDKIEVTVQSKTNPDFKRVIYVQYLK